MIKGKKVFCQFQIASFKLKYIGERNLRQIIVKNYNIPTSIITNLLLYSKMMIK